MIQREVVQCFAVRFNESYHHVRIIHSVLNTQCQCLEEPLHYNIVNAIGPGSLFRKYDSKFNLQFPFDFQKLS